MEEENALVYSLEKGSREDSKRGASSVREDNNWNVLGCSYYHDHDHQQHHRTIFSPKRENRKGKKGY